MEETQDIVAWLRERIETSDNLKRAADEIERLRGLVPRIADATPMPDGSNVDEGGEIVFKFHDPICPHPDDGSWYLAIGRLDAKGNPWPDEFNPATYSARKKHLRAAGFVPAVEVDLLRWNLAIAESDIAREREFRLRREEQCMALSEEVENLKRRHAVEDADTHGGMTQLLHRLEQANAEIDGLRLYAKDVAGERELLLAERARVCDALGIEPTDDPVEAIKASIDEDVEEERAWDDEAMRITAERDALLAEVERLTAAHGYAKKRVEELERFACPSDTEKDLRARAEKADAEIERLKKAWQIKKAWQAEEVERLRARVAEMEAEVARLDRLRKAAGIMMLGNVDAETGAICEVIEAENDADAMATPAFDALDRDDVEAAKKVLRQMEADDRLCGTLTRARLAAMISMEVVTASAVSDEEALTAWRKWAVEMAGVGEDDAQALEDETLRIGAADRWETEAQVWKDAHGHADAAHKAAMAQHDFYRARLHAEIEAHSIRASKEKL